MNDNNKHIAITWGRKLVTELGAYERLENTFMNFLNSDDNAYWTCGIPGIPGQYGDMEGHYCYIIAEGKVIYRASILGFGEGGLHTFDNGTSHYFKKKVIYLSAPVIKAPPDIKMKGFQGFRYVDELF